MPPDWWSSSKPPPGGGAWPNAASDTGRSGRLTLNEAFVGSPANLFGPPQILCSATFPQPTSSVVQVRVAMASVEAARDPVRRTFDFPAAGSPVGNGLGRLVFTYGDGAAVQRVPCDLKSGSYQLPPSDQVTVACHVASESFEDPFAPAVNITGSIAPGIHIEPTLPTYTHVIGQALANNPSPVWMPDNARDIDLWASSPTSRYGAGAPVITMHDGGGGTYVNGAAQMVRDYITGVFLPPCAARAWGSVPPGGSPFLVTSTVACGVVVQFTLDL